MFLKSKKEALINCFFMCMFFEKKSLRVKQKYCLLKMIQGSVQELCVQVVACASLKWTEREHHKSLSQGFSVILRSLQLALGPVGSGSYQSFPPIMSHWLHSRSNRREASDHVLSLSYFLLHFLLLILVVAPSFFFSAKWNPSLPTENN